MSRLLRFLAAILIPIFILISRFAKWTAWPLTDNTRVFYNWQHWLTKEWAIGGLPLWRSDLSLETWLQPESGLFSFLTLPIFRLTSDRLITFALLLFAFLILASGTYLLAKSVAQRSSLALLATLAVASIHFSGFFLVQPIQLLGFAMLPWFWLGLVKWSLSDNLRSRIFMTLPLIATISLTLYSTFFVYVMSALLYSIFLFDRNRPRTYLRFYNLALSLVATLLVTTPIWWPAYSYRANLLLLPFADKSSFHFYQGQWVSAALLGWALIGLYWTGQRRHWPFHFLAVATLGGLITYPNWNHSLIWSESMGFIHPRDLQMALGWMLQFSLAFAGLIGIKRFWAKFPRTDGVAYVPGLAAILHLGCWVFFLKISKAGWSGLVDWSNLELTQRSTNHFLIGIGFGLVSMYVFFIKDSRGTIRRSILILTAMIVAEGNFASLLRPSIFNLTSLAANDYLPKRHFEDLRFLALNRASEMALDLNSPWSVILKNSSSSVDSARNVKIAISEIEAASLVNQRGMIFDPVIIERRETFLDGKIVMNDPGFWTNTLSTLASDSQSLAAKTPVTIISDQLDGRIRNLILVSATSGIVILRINFSPFRKIVMDRKEIPSFRVDYMNQGFVIKPGQHQIEVFYDTDRVRSTFPFFYLGVALYLLWILMSFRQKRIDTWVPEIRL